MRWVLGKTQGASCVIEDYFEPNPRSHQRHHSDLLFIAQRQDTQEEVMMYLLIEHQSTVDKHMAFRLLTYLIAIWERWLTKRQENEEETLPLPVIFPLVLHQGPQKWTATQEFSGLFDRTIIPEVIA